MNGSRPTVRAGLKGPVCHCSPEEPSHTPTVKSQHHRATEGQKVVGHGIIEHLKEASGKVTGGKKLGEEIIYFQVRNCSDMLKSKGNQIVVNKGSWAHHSVFAWKKKSPA